MSDSVAASICHSHRSVDTLAGSEVVRRKVHRNTRGVARTGLVEEDRPLRSRWAIDGSLLRR